MKKNKIQKSIKIDPDLFDRVKKFDNNFCGALDYILRNFFENNKVRKNAKKNLSK